MKQLIRIQSMTHSLPRHGIDSCRHSQVVERLILLSDRILCVDASDFRVAFLNRLLSLCDLELLLLLSFLKDTHWIRFQFNCNELKTPTFADRSRSFTANFRLKRCSEKIRKRSEWFNLRPRSKTNKNIFVKISISHWIQLTFHCVYRHIVPQLCSLLYILDWD